MSVLQVDGKTPPKQKDVIYKPLINRVVESLRSLKKSWCPSGKHALSEYSLFNTHVKYDIFYLRLN